MPIIKSMILSIGLILIGTFVRAEDSVPIRKAKATITIRKLWFEGSGAPKSEPICTVTTDFNIFENVDENQIGNQPSISCYDPDLIWQEGNELKRHEGHIEVAGYVLLQSEDLFHSMRTMKKFVVSMAPRYPGEFWRESNHALIPATSHEIQFSVSRWIGAQLASYGRGSDGYTVDISVVDDK